MTITELTDIVEERMTLSSASATTRIKNHLKERYAQVLGALGVERAIRSTATANTTASQRTVTFTSVQKVLAVRISSSGARLEESTYNQMRNAPLVTADSPTQWAVQSYTNNSVTILLNSTPANIFELVADVLSGADPHEIADGSEPAFPSIFHDALVYGAMASEYAKMEKVELAQYFEGLFDKRVLALQKFTDGLPS